MLFLVTSAAGVNGDGYGMLLAFDRTGRSLGPFSSDHRISDPRGLAATEQGELLYLNSGSDRILALDRHGKVILDTGLMPQLNPGGGVFGPDGRYYVGSRTARTIMVFPPTLDGPGQCILPTGIVPFPRGFAFANNGTLFLSSGVDLHGRGDNTIVAFPAGESLNPRQLVLDPDLSPLDIAITPSGNILVSSEHPFGSPSALTTVREYEVGSGHLIRTLSAGRFAEFRKPRGLRFGSDNILYCAAYNEVVAFDFATGQCLGAVVRHRRLNGQAVTFFPGAPE